MSDFVLRLPGRLVLTFCRFAGTSSDSTLSRSWEKSASGGDKRAANARRLPPCEVREGVVRFWRFFLRIGDGVEFSFVRWSGEFPVFCFFAGPLFWASKKRGRREAHCVSAADIDL
jgi:hypothetical protein